MGTRRNWVFLISPFDIRCGVKYKAVMQMNDVFDMYRIDLERVEFWMKEALQSEVALIPEIGHHLIGSGGKRLRPLLLLCAAALFGYEGEKKYPLSTVIEFIHTATLLHDDVIDHADVRRGKVSANNIWGNAASVLVGDYLYSKAFKLMTEYGNLPVIQVLAETTNVMAEGEVFQLVKCGDVNLTETDYLQIIEKKTSHLIAAACAVGAILGQATQRQVETMTRFGLTVGSAFQIIDDTLDYVAEADAFGKVIGKDLDEGKITLPLIHALDSCQDGERERIGRILKNTKPDRAAATHIVNFINNYDGIRYAMEKAEAYIGESKAILSTFPDSPARDALYAIAGYVIARNK
jgi:octaprenyl-diphosphate synthase